MPGAPDPRAAVRVAALNKTLEQFNEEIGYKTGVAITQYHELMVAPLEARIAALEARAVPWWKRLPWKREPR